MAVKVWKILLLAGVLVILTGCWNRRELDELAIAVAIGLDMAEQNEITVSVQLVNPGEIASRTSGGPGGSPVITVSSQGKSVFEALRRMTTKLNRKVYLSHLRMVVIGDELARKGIMEPIDFLSRDHEVRSDFFIVIAKDTKAANVLDILTPQEKIPANKMFSSLDIAEKNWAATGKVTLDELIIDLESEGKSPVLTGLNLIGSGETGKTLENIETSNPPAMLKYDGLAVFKKDKLIGWLNENESKGYNYTQGKVKSTVKVIKCKGGVLDVEVIRTNSKMRGTLSKWGEPEILIDVYAEGNIGNVECDIDLLDPATIQLIEQQTEQNIKDKILEAVHSTQTHYKTDIFGFGEVLHRSYPDRWKQWKRNWDATFAGMTVHANVNVDIRRVGTINQPIKNRVRK